MDAYPIVFSDDFASGTVGSNWDIQAGNFSVDTGFSPARVKELVGGVPLSYATVSTSAYAFPADQQASCYVYSTTATKVGPIVRSSANGCYFAAMQTTPSLRYVIYKYQAGVITGLLFVNLSSLNSQTTWSLRAEGTRISLFMVESGVQVFCGGIDDSTFSSGQPGFGIAQTATPDANAYLRSFQARVSPTVPAP